MATEVLGYGSIIIANLFATASRSVVDVSRLGVAPSGWLTARAELQPSLDIADAALLAWGVQEPSGPARSHHRDQVRWLLAELSERSIAGYAIGDGPRHPSRWQRWTAANYPARDFKSALELSVRRVTLGDEAESRLRSES